MNQPFVEDKISINGIYYPFDCHIQKGIGRCVTALPHFHTYIELIHCKHGVVLIYINGREHRLEVGDLAIINSDEVHYLASDSEDYCEYICIKFEPEILYTSLKSVFEARYVLPFTINSANRQTVFKHELIRDTIVPESVVMAQQEFANKKYGFEIAIRNYIGTIFLWILRYWNDNGIDFDLVSDYSENAVRIMQEVFEYVDEKYKEDISVATLAHRCGMSYSYFSRFFKTIMNKNFNDYLNYVRINAAEKLLMTTNMNVTEIAQEVGFSTSSYFIQKFERYKNISPKQYRKMLMKSLQQD